jgi:tetratricopeptide (TPR) repeat protein
MKKVLIAVLLLLSVQLGYSQQFAKQISKSNEDIENPKKKDNPKTWIERAELMRKIYDEPTSKVTVSVSEDLLSKLIKGEQPLDTKEYVVDGEKFKAIVYDNKEIFINEKGEVTQFRTTKTEIDNPLGKAFEAYNKAAELGGDAKKIKEGLSAMAQTYTTAALGEYYAGNLDGTVAAFKKSLECSSHSAVGDLDTAVMYNIGFIAKKNNDFKTAEKYYQMAADNGYVQGGDIYGSLFEVMRAQGAQNDSVRAGKMLTEAYEKYPENLFILGSLINHYLAVGEDPEKILDILKTAQEKAPSNASLFYVEGELLMKLNKEDKAMQAYENAIRIDPTNANPYYFIGKIYSMRGDRLSNEANEKMGKEADELEAKAKAEYRKSLKYYEDAYERNKEEPAFAEILKRTYFRLREDSDEMMKKYDYYKDISDKMK